MHCAFFRPVFQPGRFAAAAGERKGDVLVRSRQAACAVALYPWRLDMRGHGFRRLRVVRGALRIRRAHQVDLHLTTALDVSFLLSILAAPRVNHVVAVSNLAENSDAHVLQQAGILPLKFGGLRGGHLINRPGLAAWFEIDSRGLPDNITAPAPPPIILLLITP